MKQLFRILTIVLMALGAGAGYSPAETSDIKFFPIQHATFVIQSDALTIYVDPVGPASAFFPYPDPDIILVTHIHRDHLDPETIDRVKGPQTLILSPESALEKLPGAKAIGNGQKFSHNGISVAALPAYNLTPERMKFHPKGRDNGYVVTLAGQRIYISGDTEDIPEMRALTEIDYAFVCMNLPYTMTIDQAASAVLAFRPKVVFPYHYRGKNGFSDIERFKAEVEAAGHTRVRLLSWY